MNLIEQLLEEIIKLNPLQDKFVRDSVAMLSDQEQRDFMGYLQYCNDTGVTLSVLAQSYDLIVKDTFKEQIYFQRHQRYRYSTYAEVASSVYQSDEYMSKYMHGLALSAFLWPNHRALHHFFLSQLPPATSGNYLEIGPGHGFYFMESMRNTQFDSYTGVDISPTSVAMTKNILSSQYFGKFDHYQINLCDFLAWQPDHRYDFIVMAEVLEHVEQPDLFLKKIVNVLNAQGQVFITTCINAPAIDHIYLYKTIDQLEKQITDANMEIVHKLIVPYTHLTLAESEKQKLPINIAMSLRSK